MKVLIHKARSAPLLSELPGKSTIQVGHFLFYNRQLPKALRRKGYLFVLIGEVAIVEYREMPAVEIKQPRYIAVRHERLSDAIDLAPCIFVVGDRKKGDMSGEKNIWRDVDEIAIRCLPNNMELCLDDDAWPLPDGPADQLSSAISNNVLWHDGEAFLEWLVQQWPALHIDQFAVAGDDLAQFSDVRKANVGDGVHVVPSNV